MELVEDNETGILVENINKDRLKSAIQNLNSDEKLLSLMSKNCIEKRKNMISLDEYCEKVLDIYKNVIQERKK